MTPDASDPSNTCLPVRSLIGTSQGVAKVKHNLSVHINDITLENFESDKLY